MKTLQLCILQIVCLWALNIVSIDAKIVRCAEDQGECTREKCEHKEYYAGLSYGDPACQKDEKCCEVRQDAGGLCAEGQGLCTKGNCKHKEYYAGLNYGDPACAKTEKCCEFIKP